MFRGRVPFSNSIDLCEPGAVNQAVAFTPQMNTIACERPWDRGPQAPHCPHSFH